MELETARHPDIWLQNRRNHYGPCDCAAAGGSDLIIGNYQTGNYTLVLSDKSKCIEIENDEHNTNLTIPPNSDVAFEVGTVIEIMQMGDFQIYVAKDSPVILRAPYGWRLTATRNACATLRQRDIDDWSLEGDLAAAPLD